MGQESAVFWVVLLVGPWAKVKVVIAEVKIMVEQKRIKDGFILIYLDCVGRIQIAIIVFILIKSNQFRQVQSRFDQTGCKRP